MGLLLATTTSQQAWSSFRALLPALMTLNQKETFSTVCFHLQWSGTKRNSAEWVGSVWTERHSFFSDHETDSKEFSSVPFSQQNKFPFSQVKIRTALKNNDAQ